jgi:hypothetical protein
LVSTPLLDVEGGASLSAGRSRRIGRTPYAVWTSEFSNAQTVAAARLRTPAFS